MSGHYSLRRVASVLGVLFVLGTAAWSLSKETVDAIGGAVAIGTAISTGEITAEAASQIVRVFRNDRLGNGEIKDVFEALVGAPAPLADRVDSTSAGAGAKNSHGMGAFVLDAHARGLKGTALAAAIHAEQARRATAGRAVDHDSRVRGHERGRSDNRARSDGRRDDGFDTRSHSGNGPGSRGRSENGNRGNR